MLRRIMSSSILQQRNYLRNNKRLQLRLPPPPTQTKPLSTTTSAADAIKPWNKTEVVECNGDYRDEAWLEQQVGGPLYSNQQQLPRLPVNPIRDTLDRFVPTALPLAESASEKQDLLQAVSDFQNQAEPLQQRLLERAKEYHDSSWLQHWWNTLGYLQVRDTIVVNVSYFFDFVNDPAARTQVQRGAALLHATACFRNEIVSGTRPADAIGRNKTPLCSTAYKYMFHACRIPQPKQDSVKIYDPALNPHVIVSRKGQFYEMNLVDEHAQQPLSVQQLERGLQQCIDMADDIPEGKYPELGWLTSSHRDDWTTARDVLLQNGGEPMVQALEKLESGAILLCLDDVNPVSKQESALLYLHGNSNSSNSTATSPANRWFDKSIQLTVTENAKAGFTGEHSLMDGMPCVAYADYVTKMTYDQCLNANDTSSSASTSCNPQPIFQPVFDQMSNWDDIEAVVEKAKADYFDFTSSFSLHAQSFHGYGSDFIKKAGFSPDAFVQQAMQVATYRLWDGQQGGTYEATQVRPFLHGRTETTRSVSTESAAFCKRMGTRPLQDEDNAAARKEKLQLLQSAVDAHVKYIGSAAKAQGVDRHFLGLQLAIQPGEETPALFNDPVFQRSKRWRVSTSHLTHPRFENWGYGPVVDDGVGLSYSIHKRHCVFNVTSLAKHQWTDKLCTLLEESLLELRTLVELDMASKNNTQSKL